jgi:ketosteroid isomerase-like protein
MTHPNEELLREAFAAFQRGDLAALQSKYFAEDIRYHVPGRSPVSGDYQGTDEVFAFFGRLFELSGGTLRLELHDVIANDQHGVALFTVRAEREGRQLADNEVLIAHPSPDGKAAEVWTQPGDQYASDEFWS